MAAARRTAIVGGGILGLTLALRLREMGDAVTVFEAAPGFGGLAGVWQIGDVTWDRHYHVTLYSDLHTRALLRDLGLADDLVWAGTETGCYAGGRLHPMSGMAGFLRFPLLGPSDKLRLAATILWASRLRDWRALEGLTVETWLRRWSGDRTYEAFWRPLLVSKLGEAHHETSAAFIWATIQRLFSARRNGVGRERFGYVRGGYARVLSRFAQVLGDRGVRLAPNSRLAEIEAVGGGLRISRAGAEGEVFDRVVVTTAPAIAASLCPFLDAQERTALEAVRYLGIVCASVLLKRPLAGCYVTNIVDDGFPFTGVIEMSALVPPRELGGRNLVYLPRYHIQGDHVVSLTDDEIRALFLSGLRRMHPDLRDGDVEAFRVSRVRHVMPVPGLNYSKTVPPFATSHPGVFLVNSSQIVNGTLNVNETVALAQRALREGLAA